MNIFLTGASGFLGRSVLKKLVSDNHTVFALSRSLESDQNILKVGGKPIRGDLFQVSTFESNLKGMDVVVHCAALVEFWGPWEKFEKGTVKTTSDLAEASEKMGVKRFIHLSSESVLQYKEPLLDVDESYPYPKDNNSYYGKAKRLAEEFLLQSKLKMEIVVIRPTFIWGPGSTALDNISTKVKSGEFMWVDNGSTAFEAVHVENVSEIVRLAITKGGDRKIYFVTDDVKSTVKEFFTPVFKALNLPQPKKSMPGWLASIAACGVESVWKTFKISSNPPLSMFELSFVNMPRRFNLNNAKKDLGYKPIMTREEGFQTLMLR